MAQFVDIEAAREFMQEALTKITPEALSSICVDLEAKYQHIAAVLEQSKLPDMTEEDVHAVLKRIFSTRRKGTFLLEKHGLKNLKTWIADLLYGDEEVNVRLEAFCERLDSVDMNIRCDLATELLHYSNPQQYWLWTRWIWDPKAKTGALPLVINEEYDLTASGIGETYLLVGKAMAFIRHVGEAAEFKVISDSTFGIDAYLCCVYIVYVYTVLRMRMTQEFNQVVPGLEEFSRRLLGIHQKKAKN